MIFPRQDNECLNLTFNSKKFKMRNRDMEKINFIIYK